MENCGCGGVVEKKKGSGQTEAQMLSRKRAGPTAYVKHV